MKKREMKSPIAIIGAVCLVGSFFAVVAVGADAADSSPRRGQGLIYTPQVANYSIHGYPSAIGEFRVDNPQLVYVSLKSGPAIYGYPHAEPDGVIALDLQYTDAAYGQAIHGYPGTGMVSGDVEILPLIVQ